MFNEAEHQRKMKARITSNRFRLWSRLVDLLNALEESDDEISAKTFKAVRHAKKLIDEISK